MKNHGYYLNKITLVLVAVILASLGIASLGAVVENVPLVLFWYLALAGMQLLLMLSVVLAVPLLLGRACKWFQRHFHPLWKEGAVGL